MGSCGVPNGVLESVLIAHYSAGCYFLGGRRRRFVSFTEFVVDETVDECGFAHTNVTN